MAKIIINVPDSLLSSGLTVKDVFRFLSGMVVQALLPGDSVSYTVELRDERL